MNNYLANALRPERAEWIPDMFYPGFYEAAQWKAYFKEHFPEGVSSILDKPRGWRIEDFQALYVACWATKPVVKGSYMIQLVGDQVGVARHGYQKFTLGHGRWTSHLHKNNKGINASSGWAFLKSYHELLVQFEEARDGKSYLFLKCEGHPAISVPHVKSYFHKKKHGVGLDVNEAMLELAKNEDLHLGIKVRAAENYSTAYKSLLTALGKHQYMKDNGEIIDVREAAPLIANACYDATVQNHGLRQWLQLRLQQVGVTFNGKMGATQFDNTNNYNMSRVYEVFAAFGDECHRVLGQSFNNPQFGHQQRPWWFLIYICGARKDFRTISQRLLKDFAKGNNTTVRYFQEIVFHPYDLDNGLEKAYNLLSQPKENLA